MNIAIWGNLLSVQNEANSLGFFFTNQRILIGSEKSRCCQAWIERCYHVCVCPLIDYSWEPIKRRAELIYHNYISLPRLSNIWKRTFSFLICFRIRRSTWNRFRSISKQKTPLSEILRKSTKDDPVAPVLSDLQFKAIDRRLRIAMNTVQRCIEEYGESAVLISDEALS